MTECSSCSSRSAARCAPDPVPRSASLPRLARPTEPARMRALRLAGRLAGAPVRGVLGPAPRLRPRAVGDRVRRARSHVRALVEGEGPEAAGGGSCGVDRRGDRQTRRRRRHARPRGPRARVGARERRPEGARRRTGCAVGAAGGRSPQAAAFLPRQRASRSRSAVATFAAALPQKKPFLARSASSTTSTRREPPQTRVHPH